MKICRQDAIEGRENVRQKINELHVMLSREKLVKKILTL